MQGDPEMSNKFTKSQLEKIIKEEIRKIVSEAPEGFKTTTKMVGTGDTVNTPTFNPYGVPMSGGGTKLKKPTYIKPEETPLQLADIVNIICSKINSIDIPGILKLTWIENKIIPDVNELIGVITNEMPPMNTAVPRPRGIDLIIKVEEILNTLENMPVPMINDMYQIPGIGPIGPEVVPPEDEDINITEQSRSSGRGYATAAKRIVTKLLSQAIPSLTVAYVVKLLIQALCRGSVPSPGPVPAPTPGPNTTPSGGGSGGLCNRFNRAARKVTGLPTKQAVKDIQETMVKMGYSVAKIGASTPFGKPGAPFKDVGIYELRKYGIDGLCGPKTIDAVKRFQRDAEEAGLDLGSTGADGIVGPITMKAIKDYIENGFLFPDTSGRSEFSGPLGGVAGPDGKSLDDPNAQDPGALPGKFGLREVKDQLSKWKKLWS